MLGTGFETDSAMVSSSGEDIIAGRGGTGGVTGLESDLECSPISLSSSSTSARTANSPDVSAFEAAKERRFKFPRSDFRALLLLVILEILYVEKRLEARRSRTSLFLSAARESATAGIVSMGDDSACWDDASFSCSVGASGLDGSTITGGVAGTGLSMREYLLTLAGTSIVAEETFDSTGNSGRGASDNSKAVEGPLRCCKDIESFADGGIGGRVSGGYCSGILGAKPPTNICCCSSALEGKDKLPCELCDVTSLLFCDVCALRLVLSLCTVPSSVALVVRDSDRYPTSLLFRECRISALSSPSGWRR